MSDIDDRIAQRRRDVRADRQRRRRRRTVAVVLALVVIAALIVVERSALVGLEEVRVVGTDRLEPADVVAASQLELGTSTLRLRLGEVEERVARRLPLVGEVDARRVDPLTVQLEVTERVPALVVRSGDERFLLDRDGVVLTEGAVDGLPAIVLAGPTPEPGDRVGDHPALANAHTAWRGLSGPLRSEVVRYDAEGAEELTLRLRSDVRVRFGRADRIDEKVRALGAVLEDIGGEQDVAVIDVRAPSRPVVEGR